MVELYYHGSVFTKKFNCYLVDLHTHSVKKYLTYKSLPSFAINLRLASVGSTPPTNTCVDISVARCILRVATTWEGLRTTRQVL